MKVKIEDAGPCRKVLSVDAPAVEVVEEYDKVVAAYRKAARIPGFRKGKAPADVVESRFRKGIIEDAKERLIPLLYRGAVQKEGINPVAVVGVSDVVLARNDGMSFRVTFDVAPDFKLPKYKRISLKKNAVRVEDKEVEEAFSALIDRFARFDKVEGEAAVTGDLVEIDYRGMCEGRAISEFASDCTGLGEGKDFLALVGEPEFLPGMAGYLRGMSPGETRDAEIRFPDDFQVPAVAGRTAVYTVTMKGVRRKVLPELDADFLKRFEAGSEKELRGKIAADLVEAAERREKERLKGEIGQFLLSKVSFDLPASIVTQERDAAVRNIVNRSAMSGVTKEQLAEKRGDILDAATRSSTERVKLLYILGKIADEEKLEVVDSEVNSRIDELAAGYRTTPERLRAEMEKRDGLDGLRSDILAGKTLEFLLDNAKVK